MGCANSKPKRCQHCHCNCNTPYYSSVPRSFSVHVHHPPQTKGDSYHVVALTSTTLGSLDHGNGLRFPNGKSKSKVIDSDSFRSQNNEEEENEAKTSWTDMIEQILPKAILKTPTSTPPHEPETINTWELMEGLEDTTSPLRSPKHFKSFSFDVNVNGHLDPSKPCGFVEGGKCNNDSAEPMWSQMSEEGSNGFDFDYSQENKEIIDGNGFSIQEEKIISDDDVMDLKDAALCEKDRVVLYFTSLRGVRKTYEDCCNVRLILKGLGVRLDERDVSMHSGFKEELKELLGHGYGKGGLPKVFVGRNYIGGAEDIQQLHEDGRLEKLLDCCEKIDNTTDGVDDGGVCEACGDVRFVPCETCFGSCKIYYDGDNEDDEDEQEDGDVSDYGFQRCPDCNENGLIRCPMCCY
ncbi:hypothetical protein Fmac_016736 [Flemingia macrophylla]|uniref:Glutaredoxin domain-containing protein n=1 Tax=Flemingia macrophylla TaxID=520843 RepID=A0ABD1MJ26_9FABA